MEDIVEKILTPEWGGRETPHAPVETGYSVCEPFIFRYEYPASLDRQMSGSMLRHRMSYHAYVLLEEAKRALKEGHVNDAWEKMNALVEWGEVRRRKVFVYFLELLMLFFIQTGDRKGFGRLLKYIETSYDGRKVPRSLFWNCVHGGLLFGYVRRVKRLVSRHFSSCEDMYARYFRLFILLFEGDFHQFVRNEVVIKPGKRAPAFLRESYAYLKGIQALLLRKTEEAEQLFSRLRALSHQAMGAPEYTWLLVLVQIANGDFKRINRSLRNVIQQNHDHPLKKLMLGFHDLYQARIERGRWEIDRAFIQMCRAFPYRGFLRFHIRLFRYILGMSGWVDNEGTLRSSEHTFFVPGHRFHRLPYENLPVLAETDVGALVGQSQTFIECMQDVEKYVKIGEIITLVGETGTGKDLVARAIHEFRGKGEFVPVHCGAIPETLFESILFGYRKGLFTGADQDQPGLLEGVRDGTVFFDEFHTLTPGQQVKFLRVLETGMVQRLGEGIPRSLSCQFIIGVQPEIFRRISNHEFRLDLYYRMNQLLITLPPLRERQEDIVYLIAYFLMKYREKVSHCVEALTDELKTSLCAYAWPGNVRQLAHSVLKTLLKYPAEKVWTHEHWQFDDMEGTLPSTRSRDTYTFVLPSIMPFHDAVTLFRKHYVEWVLQQAGGSRTQASRLLHVSRVTVKRCLSSSPSE